MEYVWLQTHARARHIGVAMIVVHLFVTKDILCRMNLPQMTKIPQRIGLNTDHAILRNGASKQIHSTVPKRIKTFHQYFLFMVTNGGELNTSVNNFT